MCLLLLVLRGLIGLLLLKLALLLATPWVDLILILLLIIVLLVVIQMARINIMAFLLVLLLIVVIASLHFK